MFSCAMCVDEACVRHQVHYKERIFLDINSLDTVLLFSMKTTLNVRVVLVLMQLYF